MNNYKFEIPYNFDMDLIDMIYKLDPIGKMYYCIYLPPYSKHYNSVLRSFTQKDAFNSLTLDDYVSHIKYINSKFDNKIQLILQRSDEILDEQYLDFYINLGITKFCCGSYEQAKQIKNKNSNFEVVGSITMGINKTKILKHPEYKEVFDSFVLGFSFTKDIDRIKNLPKDFNYILLANAYCSIYCDGVRHWFCDPKKLGDRKSIGCPGTGIEINWEEKAQIRPMDTHLFSPYISVFKLGDRAWPTRQIIKDLILYSNNYNYPGIEYTENLYKRRVNNE